MTKKMLIHDVDVSLQIWDTAGQERFQQGTLGNSFYRGSHGALLVYDVNNKSSIEQIAQWRDECLSRQEDDTFFPIVVIGNKTDIRAILEEMLVGSAEVSLMGSVTKTVCTARVRSLTADSRYSRGLASGTMAAWGNQSTVSTTRVGRSDWT